ncbi:MAG: hypothetical protein K2Q18_11765 [Bdellovibrionales bacterium]|nr:hypothetical protein [Bdellovibrionales bacterium]
MKFLLIIVFVLLSLLSFNTYAAAPKHLVFLIHGIAAGPSTFGQMEKTLRKEAKNLGGKTDYQIHSFSYETGNYNKNVTIFSRELSDFIAKKFLEAGGLNPEDKYSLIMHSQGGLVGLNFLIKSYTGVEEYHPELQGHIDAFITLGTPYWGAKIAIFANRIVPILSYLNIPILEELLQRFGQEELTDMELASDFSAEMRRFFTDKENFDIVKRIKNDTRFLIYSGVTERLNILAPFTTGKNRYEDDTAVPIPSSKLDFIYYVDSDLYHPDSVGVLSFKETNIVNNDNYVVVNAFHSSPFPQKSKYPGIAKVPDRCVDISFRDCDHPTYPGVVEHLLGLERDPAFIRDLMSFAIDLKINTKGEEINRKKLTLSFKALTSGLTIGKEGELYNRVGRWTSSGDYRLYHTGYIDSKKTSTLLGRVELTISLPGFRERKLTVPVKTTMSTFIVLL